MIVIAIIYAAGMVVYGTTLTTALSQLQRSATRRSSVAWITWCALTWPPRVAWRAVTALLEGV